MLGTSSQVPTRQRAHHGALLRWDDETVLFDPGELDARRCDAAVELARGADLLGLRGRGPPSLR